MRFKKLGCSILAIILSLSFAVPVNSYAAGRFSDTAGHWAEKYINTAVNENIITGYPDGKFLPDKAVTRAEFATMVNKALGNTSTENITFRDVPSREWYYSDVSKAVAAAYTAGYDDNTFRPNNQITRQEAAVMLSRIVPSYGEEGNLRAYSDYRSIADWAYDAVEKVNGKGYIGAYSDGNIHPVDPLTRAQTAKIICDIIDNESIVKSNTVIDDDGTKLSGKIYSNTVTVDEDLGEDSATIDNCVILGTLSIKGGGTETITVNNSRVANAVVNKDDDPVRVLAKGETAIVNLSASQASILQTSGLSGGLFGPGFSSITANSSADVILRGSFPKVIVSGTKADVTLDTGTINLLTVNGKNSDITADSGTTISTATVNTESYFHGSGTISQMNVNADGITYETKPKKWTIKSSVDTPKEADGSADITFSPKSGATNVKIDTNITITFDTEMEMYNGDSITSLNINDFVELRKGSSSGSKVAYSASINSAKTIITINPSANLSEDTKYYVIIKENKIRDDDNEDGNKAQSISFTTGDDTGSVTTTFSPADGATGVPVNSNITIKFSDDVVKYSNGASISSSDAYLKECLVFKKTNSSGTSVSYSATINSSKDTITINPSSDLTKDQKYYVAVVGNKLMTEADEEVVAAKSVTWTAGVITPVVNTLTLTPGETTISASLTSNVAGTAYLVALPSGDTAPNAAQIIAGQNGAGIAVDSSYKATSSVSANTSKSFSFTGFASNTQYKVYAIVRANSVNSAVKSTLTTTVTPVTRLSDLEVIPTVDGLSNPGDQISFSSTDTTYDVTLNTSITELTVNAAGSGDISIDGEETTSKGISLSGTDQTISVEIEKAGTDGTTYTIDVTRSNNADYSSLAVSADDDSLNASGEGVYELDTTGDVDIDLTVVAEDKFATVIMEDDEAADGTIRTGSTSFELPASTDDQEFVFWIVSGSESAKYTITFIRP